jgi:predicted O-methyltransferase YrrM
MQVFRPTLDQLRALVGRRRPSPPPALRALQAAPGSWIDSHLSASAPQLAEGAWSALVERRAAATERLGRQPLWSRYESLGEIGGRTYAPGATRSSNEVRTIPQVGRFFAWLVVERRPGVVVEFGTAFGVSGMYWLSGLEMNRAGRLLTFEPNRAWAGIARDNLTAVGSRAELTVGTFEENIDCVLGAGEKIDIAFMDAIHTSDFVVPQFQAVAARLAAGGLVLLDDIDFSDDMRSCWEVLRGDARVAASVEVDRVGVLEFRR